MRTGLIVAAGLIVGVAGCSEVTMVPLNEQAKADGSPRLAFVSGVPGGPLRVTMPSGEKLAGFYSISETQFSPAPSVTGGGTTAPGADEGGNFHANAHGPVTKLVCRANLVAGHGDGTCRGQDGALYKLPL